MNELELINNKKIENMIYEIRGVQVIFDFDLAKLYGVETKRINEAVRRNIKKFPERFSWNLTDEESSYFLVAVCDQKTEKRGGRYKNPRVFSEQGVAMLSTILKTDIAIEISIKIIDAFVAMRRFLSSNLLEQKHINNMVYKLDERVSILENYFLDFKSFNNEIFYEGQLFDAYVFLLDIFDTSRESIIIVDNFADKELFKLLSKTNKKVTVYSKNINDDLINKYKKQYDNVTLIYNNSYHDRFIIIDKKTLYHCGASFKDLGKKCFAINKIDNKEMIDEMLIRL